MLYIAIGILGATVMPHNLYLHSSIVQTRRYIDTLASKTRSDPLRDDRLVGRADVGALHQRGDPDRGGRGLPRHRNEAVADIGDAYKLLSPLLGTTPAGVLFAVALLCSGQNATLTGTLAGQIVMEGFVNIRLRPWLRRLITRLVAIVPAVIVVMLYGERGTGALLILSQVILSLQLPFAVFPLVSFTSDRRKMGAFVAPLWMQVAGLDGRGYHCGAERLAAVPDVRRLARCIDRILVAVENSPADRTILTHVRQLAALTGAEMLLVHVADGWAARHFEQLQAARVGGDEGRSRLPRAAARRAHCRRRCKVADRAGDGRSGHRAHSPGRGAQGRSHRDVHARPPLPQRSRCAARRSTRCGNGEDSRAAAARAVNPCSMTLRTAIATPDGKRRYVRRLFATIADRYDFITGFLSYGQDRKWKRRLIAMAELRATDCVLDLACGTGDLLFSAVPPARAGRRPRRHASDAAARAAAADTILATPLVTGRHAGAAVW